MFKTINKPLIMGILNVTPDSFSDGGLYDSSNNALGQAKKMIDEGVDIIDIGGESTRPGAERVTVTEQIKRVLPVIKSIREQFSTDINISIDTTKSEVAEAALSAGANMINDISAGRDDAKIFALAARHQLPIILMHMHGTPANMQDQPNYQNVVAEVLEFLLERVEIARQVGINPDLIAIDPGIGFGKRKQDNIDLIAGLKAFVDSGYPVLLGASRKRFMGAICDVSEPSELVAATVVSTALGVMAGVQMFRVHDVKENRQALDVAWAIKQA
jgi:dihydropteroate synthase